VETAWLLPIEEVANEQNMNLHAFSESLSTLIVKICCLLTEAPLCLPAGKATCSIKCTFFCATFGTTASWS
jgi:hypothetical protein